MKNTNSFTIVLLLFLIPFFTKAQQISNIHELFDALKDHPEMRADSLVFAKANVGKEIVYSQLYPKLSAFGTFDHSSKPAGIIPIPPDVLFPMIQDPGIPQPFSQNIFRAGAAISMPLFVKSIYTMGNSAKHLLSSGKAKHFMNLQQNEAIIVGSNASLFYMDALIKALESKKRSLLKTKDLIALKVRNGRAPGSSAMIIENHINQVDISLNQIRMNREKAISSIQNLTGIRLSEPVNMIETGIFKADSLRALEPLAEKVSADELALRAEKEKLLPGLYLKGNYNHSYARSYNNDMAVNEDYSVIGVVLSLPVFNKTQYGFIKKSKIEYETARNEYEKLRLSLITQGEELQKQLTLLDESIQLYQASVKSKEDILKIQKASYNSNRISIEDYLKYEDDLVLEKSKLYKAVAERWQTLMKLAVIYGNNIENLVK